MEECAMKECGRRMNQCYKLHFSYIQNGAPVVSSTTFSVLRVFLGLFFGRGDLSPSAHRVGRIHLLDILYRIHGRALL